MSNEKLEALMWRQSGTNSVWVHGVHARDWTMAKADSAIEAEDFVASHNAQIRAAHAHGVDDGAKWNAMLRPADIVAARIEGLREGFALAYDKFEMKGASRGYDAWQEPEATPTVEPVIDLMAALKDALEKRKGAGR